MKLNTIEFKVKSLLISVAQGRTKTHKPGYISYKEVWSHIQKEPWYQSRTRRVVEWIANISKFELSEGRPPLNELVVRTNKTVPTEPWQNLKELWENSLLIKIPFKSHEEAQQECWSYWGRNYTQKKLRAEKIDRQAEEGYKQDRTVTFRKRNASIIAERKKIDKNTCQACGFKMEINGKFIIDCHHIYPLGHTDEIKVTYIEHLKCLCPTCHRIAHTRHFPLSEKEIAKLRKL